MSKLYYGSGDCTIEGGEIRGIEINYKGAVLITKTAGDNFALIANDKKIIIFPIGGGFLNNLFSYKGEIEITHVAVVNNNEIIPCTIKRAMDYSELITTNAEDLTTNSEGLKASHLYGIKVKKTRVLDNYIKNQHSNGELFLSNGEAYSGAFHVHTDTGRAMTGGEHTELSQYLYVRRIKDNKLRRT